MAIINYFQWTLSSLTFLWAGQYKTLLSWIKNGKQFTILVTNYIGSFELKWMYDAITNVSIRISNTMNINWICQ